MTRYFARHNPGGMVYIEDLECADDHRNNGIFFRPQYTLEEAREVCRWLNAPREFMNAFERLYTAIALFYRDKGIEPTAIKLEEIFYYELLRDSPLHSWYNGRAVGFPTEFYGVPFTIHKNQDVDYILEGKVTVQ